MSLTLGLNTAISGLSTNQRQLDVIAQNVANVNTAGYTRKLLPQESRVLAGFGSGVQTTDLQRSVDEGLLKHLRKEAGNLSQLKVVDEYLERLGQQFGTPADNTSIAHIIGNFNESLEALANQVNKQTSYLGAVRAAQDVTDLINRMSTEIQQLRTDADQRISDVVTKINDKIGEIHTLNSLITKNNATGTGTGDLIDKRDTALTKLSEYVDISYYQLSDGGVAVYTASGMLMVDSTPQLLDHTAVSRIQAVNTKAGGGLDGITIGGVDITADIRSGELKGLISIRDDSLTNFQASLDQLASEVMNRVNLIHNRGTTFPDMVSSMTGTRTFADQDNVSQQIRLASGTTDTMVTLFDTDGAQVAAASLDSIMTTNYGAGDLAAQGSRGWWTINEVSAHVEAWLQASGITGASAGLNSEGKLAINLNDSSYTLAFRDQVSGTAGAAAGDASIEFDVDGNGVAEQTVSGFSSFFGLNDLFVTNKNNWLYDSSILPTATTTAAVSRTIRVYDQSGQLGSNIVVPANSTLEQTASKINRFSAVLDTGIQQTGYTIPGALAGQSLTLNSPSGAFGTYVAVAGDTLSDVATAITAMGLTATVVDDGNGQRLRVVSAAGVEVSASGTLATELGVERRELVKASVVPEGAGFRLRIQHQEAGEMFIGADTDVSGKSLLTDLGIGVASAARAETLTVNQVQLDAPYRLSRGAVQYDATKAAYYIHEGDNTTALALAAVSDDKAMISGAGDIGSGTFGLSEYAATVLSMSAREHSVTKDRLDYQSKLAESIQFQHDSLSGVNVDEEVANLITFQQAYAASAKVITTLQEMLEILTSMIK